MNGTDALSRVQRISDDLSVVDLMPSVPGFEGFLGCYVLRGEEIALIDVGPANCSEALLQGLSELDIRPGDVTYLLATHVHIDHAGGLGTIAKQMRQARVLVHQKGKPHVIDPERLWKGSQATLGQMAEMYGKIEPVPEDQVVVAEEGMVLDLGRDIRLRAVMTPGHASHHLSFVESRDNLLFAGEAAGICIRGAMRPASPPPFHLEQALASLDRLIAEAPSVVCYGHFGSADNGTNRLLLHREQLVLWGEVVAACFADGADGERIVRELMQKDRLLKDLDNLAGEQRSREEFFLRNSIQGFLRYYDRFGIPAGTS
jgi:glyoxylase-like metal-dependent hydrolase (beta-lactamase superfamily II)